MVLAEAIRELRDAGLGAPSPDESFDRFARLVHRQLGVPTALVSLVLDDEQVLPGAHGLPTTLQRERRLPLTHSFCRHVVDDDEPLIVDDARRVPRLAGNPAIPDLGVIAYAGFPIFDTHGRTVGSLCAIDDHPHAWTEVELATLADLASACTSELRLRVARDKARRMQHVAVQATRRSRLLLELSESFAGARSVSDVVENLAHVGATIDARWVGLALVDPSGHSLTFTTLDHLEPRLAPEYRRVRFDDDRPSAVAARTQRPLFFRGNADLTAAFPGTVGAVDEDAGARAFLPVLRESRLLGVMMLAWDVDRDFDAEAVKTELAIASYVAHALERVQLLEERHLTATTLQTAMLSPLPQIRHLELAFLYSPAASTDQVGGDWYDAVVLDEDASVLMVGDVTGHDMHAAAQMGQLRSILRTFAWSQDEAPSTLMRLLDRANQGLGLNATATAVVARLDRRPDLDHGTVHVVTWSNAGHPPPFILRADGTVEACAGEPDIMLGVVPGSPRHDRTAVLTPGDTLLLYTDGLVELRGARYAERLAALQEALAAFAGTATTALPGALVRRLVTERQRDDIAVLAVRVRHAARAGARPGRPTTASLDVAAVSTAIAPARRWVDDVLEGGDVSSAARRTAMLLTSELVTNAVQHASPPIAVEVEIGHRTLHVAVSDGSPEVPRLLSPEPHEIGGRGVQFLERRASQWGVTLHDDAQPDGQDAPPPGARKTVWFEIDRLA